MSKTNKIRVVVYTFGFLAGFIAAEIFPLHILMGL